MRRFFPQQNNFSQSGITLILAVLILAAVSALSFSLGALAIREIKSSRQLLHSEPALTAAEAGGETALFFRTRGLDQYKEVCPTTTSGNLSSGSASFEVCSDLYDDPFNFSTAYNDIDVVILDNPLDTSDPRAGYSSVTISPTAGTATVIRAFAYDLANPSVCPVDSFPISVPGTGTLSGLDPNKSYAVFIYPCGDTACEAGKPKIPSCASGTASGTMTGVANIGADSFNGIPSESPKINSTGRKNNLLRRLELLLNP